MIAQAKEPGLIREEVIGYLATVQISCAIFILKTTSVNRVRQPAPSLAISDEGLPLCLLSLFLILPVDEPSFKFASEPPASEPMPNLNVEMSTIDTFMSANSLKAAICAAGSACRSPNRSTFLFFLS
jgi:hypothetical protein